MKVMSDGSLRELKFNGTSNRREIYVKRILYEGDYVLKVSQLMTPQGQREQKAFAQAIWSLYLRPRLHNSQKNKSLNNSKIHD